MYQKSELLLSLFDEYEIKELEHGAREDKLGDVFEEYCVTLLCDTSLLKRSKTNAFDKNNMDELVFNSLVKHFPDYTNIKSIEASNKIEHRYTGGNPKTDVIADIVYNNGKTISFPISVKHTTASKVAMAEFDVDTIVREIGITDKVLINLMEKHQTDASAKYFTKSEKEELKNRLRPFKKEFVKWVVSGCSSDSEDLKFPKTMLKIQITKHEVGSDELEEIKDIKCYTIDDYVQKLLYKPNGKPASGGFGTGLSWTYATGTKGRKIQFKG